MESPGFSEVLFMQLYSISNNINFNGKIFVIFITVSILKEINYFIYFIL